MPTVISALTETHDHIWASLRLIPSIENTSEQQGSSHSQSRRQKTEEGKKVQPASEKEKYTESHGQKC
jgi:hypothetical protein